MNDTFDWYQVKYLESTANLTDLIRERSGIDISHAVATDIAVNLQQGRAFFEQSELAAMEIRPLLIFYGMLAFARAIILSRRNVTLSTLAPKHGLSDAKTTNGLLETLEVRIQHQGTFTELIDSTRCLEKLIVHDEDAHTETKLSHPPDGSNVFAGKSINLKEILARIPDVGQLYRETFKDVRRVVGCSHFRLDSFLATTELEIYDYEGAEDRGILQARVTSLRSRYPFLNEWCVLRASKQKGSVTFCTWPRNESTEFSVGNLREDTTEFIQSQPEPRGNYCVADPRPRVSPIYGNLHDYTAFGNLHDKYTTIIEPIHAAHISELALYYAGMYLLSSLVRYRPTIWANSISRRPIGSVQPDDKPLALIEQFLQLATKRFPRMTVNAIREPD